MMLLLITLLILIFISVRFYLHTQKPAKENPKERLGIATWTLLHAVVDLSPPDKLTIIKRWITDLSLIYPCTECKEDMQAYITENPIDDSTSATMVKWMFKFHNHVNQKLGKPLMTPSEYVDSPIRVASCPSCFRGRIE